MGVLNGEGTVLLAAGYAALGLVLAVDLATWIFSRSSSCRLRRDGDIQDGDGDKGHGGWQFSGKVFLLVALCLVLLGLSMGELFVSCEATDATVCPSRSFLAAVWARIAFAALVPLWLLGQAAGRGGPGTSRATTSALGTAAVMLLVAILLWRALHLAYTALVEFPRAQTLVYLEGLCAIGSVGAVSLVWSLHVNGGGVLLSSDEGGLESAALGRETVLDALDGAGWVSVVTFSWLNPLFKTGASRQLEPTDLCRLARQDRSALWAERFRVALEKERKFPRPSFLRACGDTFGREFLTLGWLKAVNTGIGFSGPLLLKVVVDAVQDSSSSTTRAAATTRGYLGAAGLIVCYALSAVLDTQFNLSLARLQLHIRASLVAAVYRQVLKVRTAAACQLDLTAGSATNLIAVDAQRLMDCAGSLHELWGLPVQVAITFYLLHREVSFAFAAGLIVIIGMIPLNAALAKRIGAATRKLMGHKDVRVERCSELLHGIRAVKMLAWESCMRDRIDVSRRAEVSALSTLKYVDAWCVFFWATTPTLVCLATFATLVVVRGEGAAPLRVSSVFAAISLLQMLIHPMNAFPWVMNGIVEANVSKARLEKLLMSPTKPGSSAVPAGHSARSARNKDGGLDSSEGTVLSWKGVTVYRKEPGDDNDSATSPLGDNSNAISGHMDGGLLEPLLPRHDGEEVKQGMEEDTYKSEFAVRNVDLEIRRGETVGIVGEVGSGKSMLIAGILGELPVRSHSRSRRTRYPSNVDVDVDALVGIGAQRVDDTAGETGLRVCYAAQNPWVMSGTVRENILFGLPMKEDCYRETVSACALEADLATIPGGDLAFVGERGATLSGGQRRRVSLARCAYSALSGDTTDIAPSVLCLLDDPLTSLDATTRDHVSQHCIHGLLSANPGIAVVVACGEISPPVSSTLTGKEHATVNLMGDTSLEERESEATSASASPALSLPSSSTPAQSPTAMLQKPEEAPPCSHKTSLCGDDGLATTSNAPSVEKTRQFDKIVTLCSGRATTTAACTATAKHPRTPDAIHRPVEVQKPATTGKPPALELLELFDTDRTGISEGCSPNESSVHPDCGLLRDDSEPLRDDMTNRNIDGLVRDKRINSFNEGISDVQCGEIGSMIEETKGECSNGQETDGAGPVEDEERKDGSVELKVCVLYVKAAGVLVTLTTLASLGAMQASAAGFSYWLSRWATHQGGTSVRSFLATSFSIAAANAVFTLVRAFGFAYGGLQAARVLHRRLLTHVLRKKTRFFDVTPSGRVVNRFSRDAFSVDEDLPFHLNVLLAQSAGLMATLVVLSYTSPLLILLFLPLGVVYGRLQRYYRGSSRELRRLDSTSRSPLYALFSETLDGAVTIRAFQQQDMFFQRFMDLLAANQRATFSASTASVWLSLRLQALGVVVIGAVALVAVTQEHFRRLHPGSQSAVMGLAEGVGGRSDNGGLVGLSLTYALPIVGNLTGLLGALTETEREMISVERMDEYCRDRTTTNGIQSGSGPGPMAGKVREDEEENSIEHLSSRGAVIDVRSGVSAAWPDKGSLEVTNVVMRYRQDLAPSLAGACLTVASGEKVGIVGRTGSGKTSLVRILFGLYAYEEGTVCIDGVDISKLPLAVLRSRLAVIPQEPLLFRGTVRENLDPSGTHSDAALWAALRSCNLAGPVDRVGAPSTNNGADGQTINLQANGRDGGGGGSTGVVGLDTVLDGLGGNVSTGQRQLLCIARALLRQTNLVCMDEATSTMDATTAEVIDTTVFKAFRDSTVVAVAHRLDSVVKHCDSVAVMSEGKIVERGIPSELSEDTKSVFSALLRSADGKKR